MAVRDQHRLKNATVAELNPAVQIHALEDSTKVVRTLAATSASANLPAEFIGISSGVVVRRVLDVEDGLAGIDELVEALAFGVFGIGSALLIYGEVDNAHDVGYDVRGVFETYGHVVLAGLVVEEMHIIDRIFCGKAQVVFSVLLNAMLEVVAECVEQLHLQTHRRCQGQWHHSLCLLPWRFDVS